ncbi:hypothetical protein [Natronorubrum daqingense]|uniref:Uncharacterized protein n=1 Tax=Natronorubrum daqingense TaxID=588898 RepID=A0A1N7F9L2_9EURY|nr:hypothetical protein [Natronorubrum daqingense]APX97626.1 hypothetical protein BB347_13970 [Natronorubrum daqingense]SIR96915.1 hypothetical protein SAMN05421809_3117 [Natronorubrum daqingense]
MRRLLALAAGLFVAVVPNPFVETVERLAFENADVGRRRPWTVPIARLKGAVFCLLLVRSPHSIRALSGPLAALGFVLAVLSRRALEVGLRVAYENPDDLEVKPWVLPTARVLGASYVAVALFSRRATTDEDESLVSASE